MQSYQNILEKKSALISLAPTHKKNKVNVLEWSNLSFLISLSVGASNVQFRQDNPQRYYRKPSIFQESCFAILRK